MDTQVRHEMELDDKPLKELMRDLSRDSVTLVRQETELFKKEMEGRIHRVEREATVLGTGGVVAFTGLLALTAALVFALDRIMPDWAAALLVGAAYVIAGLVLVFRGKNELGKGTIAPETTMGSVNEDVRTFKEAMHRGH